MDEFTGLYLDGIVEGFNSDIPKIQNKPSWKPRTEEEDVIFWTRFWAGRERVRMSKEYKKYKGLSGGGISRLWIRYNSKGEKVEILKPKKFSIDKKRGTHTVILYEDGKPIHCSVPHFIGLCFIDMLVEQQIPTDIPLHKAKEELKKQVKKMREGLKQGKYVIRHKGDKLDDSVKNLYISKAGRQV